VWDLAAAPALTSVMRGHDGRVLCVCWVRLARAIELGGSEGGGSLLLDSGRPETSTLHPKP